MIKTIFMLLLATEIFAFFDNIETFRADYVQTITDEKSKKLTYKGHIIASKPQNILWKYKEPIKKDVYINMHRVTIIEPEIEQVIIRDIESDFDFFKMIKNAKEIEKNLYVAYFENSKFTITTNDKLIESISYIDEFENSVEIVFKNQEQNRYIDENIFDPIIPTEYDIIRD